MRTIAGPGTGDLGVDMQVADAQTLLPPPVPASGPEAPLLVQGVATPAGGGGDGGYGRESVIGEDERSRVEDTGSPPWRMICALRISSDFGDFVGTGWLAGPRTVITAGHCVFDAAQMGGWAKSVTVIPGQNGADKPFGEQVATRFFTSDAWKASQDPDYDYAAIVLPDPLPDSHGWFGVGALSDAELRDHLVNVSGYPGDKGGDEQWWAKNRVKGLTDRRIFYDVDTMGGQSGGPVYIVPDAGHAPLVVGIHAYGVGGTKPDVITEDVNSAPRIVPDVVAIIRQWIAASGG